MNDDDPGSNSMSRKVNRRAQFSLINHEKYKYNDLCILFMDGMALWRDGNIQIGLTKYPMSRLTKCMVHHKYKKLYRREESFLRIALRYLIMTSVVSGALCVGISLNSRKQSSEHTNIANKHKIEQFQLRIKNDCYDINNVR